MDAGRKLAATNGDAIVNDKKTMKPRMVFASGVFMGLAPRPS